jgi:hypothetical protein
MFRKRTFCFRDFCCLTQQRFRRSRVLILRPGDYSHEALFVSDITNKMIKRYTPFHEKELLFPLISAFILRVDRENKVLYVELPDGLVDIYR